MGLKAGIILPLAGSALLSCKTDAAKEQTEEKPEVAETKKLNILILGGTGFLGPHQIAYALKNGHSILIFTRGKTQPTIYKDLFGKVEQLVGDRADNLEVLRGRKWDAVIDNSGHKADRTKATAELLKENVGMYLYTSSTGVYYPYLGDNITENTDLALKIPDEIEDEYIKAEYGYGVMKANSEPEAERIFGEDRTVVVRPTQMTGPADKTDRFIHWPIRLNRGGRVLVPGKTDDPVQIIDVRDVAEWMIRLIENKKAGTFNAVGPKAGMTMPEFVKEAHSAFTSEAEFVQADDYDFLKNKQSLRWFPGLCRPETISVLPG